MTGDGTRTFEWDAENRLLAINQGTLRSEFSYDGENRRVRIVEKSGSTVTSDRRFLWCMRSICEERSSSGGTVVKRYFADGVQQSGQAYFYSRDHLGSIRELSDAVAAIKARYDYDPYGKRSAITEDQVADFGFTGHYEHTPSGTTFTLFRAYAPSVGRWLSEDPAGLRTGPNLYAYVENKTTTSIDPTGWASISVTGPTYTGFPDRDDVIANCGGLNAAGCVRTDGFAKCDCVKDGCQWRPSVRISLDLKVFYWSTEPRSRTEEQKHVDAIFFLLDLMKRDAEGLERMRFSSKILCEFHCLFAEFQWVRTLKLQGPEVDRTHPPLF
jgi:RHS repeat-associated protein